MVRDAQATTTTTVGSERPTGEPESDPRDEARPTAAPSVPLDDLLTIAVLTPAQAVLVAAELLGAGGTSGPPPGRVSAMVTADGTVEVATIPTGTGRRVSVAE